MQRLLLRSIFALALFAISLSLANKLVAGIAYLMLRAGTPLLRDWIQAHTAWRSFCVGSVAGLAPASLCFSSFLWFAPRDNPDRNRVSKFLTGLNVDSAQPWTWIFFTPLFCAIVLSWIHVQSQSLSVFGSMGSHYSISNFVDYWNSQLQYMDLASHLYAQDWDWMKLVLYIQLLAASIGYSLAPTWRKLLLSIYESQRQHSTQFPADDAAESTINETTELK